VGRRGIRTDTMIVLSIDPATGWVAMFGIPRNLWGLPLPPGHPAQGSFACGDCFGAIANEIYPWGLGRPDLFGEESPGAAAAEDLLGHLLGIDIHYFALVDLAGFVDVIDALGGVDIVVQHPIHDDEYTNVDGTYSVKDLAPAPITWTATRPCTTPAPGMPPTTSTAWAANAASCRRWPSSRIP